MLGDLSGNMVLDGWGSMKLNAECTMYSIDNEQGAAVEETNVNKMLNREFKDHLQKMGRK